MNHSIFPLKRDLTPETAAEGCLQTSFGYYSVSADKPIVVVATHGPDDLKTALVTVLLAKALRGWYLVNDYYLKPSNSKVRNKDPFVIHRVADLNKLPWNEELNGYDWSRSEVCVNLPICSPEADIIGAEDMENLDSNEEPITFTYNAHLDFYSQLESIYRKCRLIRKPKQPVLAIFIHGMKDTSTNNIEDNTFSVGSCSREYSFHQNSLYIDIGVGGNADQPWVARLQSALQSQLDCLESEDNDLNRIAHVGIGERYAAKSPQNAIHFRSVSKRNIDLNIVALQIELNESLRGISSRSGTAIDPKMTAQMLANGIKTAFCLDEFDNQSPA